MTVSSGDEVGETGGHGQCWHRHRGRCQEGKANSVSSAGQASQLPLLNLCHMPDPFINVHRQPHTASYGEVGAQPPPHPLTPRLCRFHFFICLFNFPIAENAPLSFCKSVQKIESLLFKTSVACNFQFLPFVLIKSKPKRIFLYDRKLFLSGQPYFNRMFLFSC